MMVPRLSDPELQDAPRMVLARQRRDAVVEALSQIAPRTVRQLCIAVHGTIFPSDRIIMDMILYDLHDAGIAKRAGPVSAFAWDERWVLGRDDRWLSRRSAA